MLAFLRQPFNTQPKHVRADFAHWLQKRAGQALLANEKQVLDEFLSSLVGCRALQIDVGANVDLLDKCGMAYRWSLTGEVNGQTDLLMEPASLPIANHCVDLVLLHHTLDFDNHPYRILNEATRVLNPGGTLLVVGFNPVSLLGLQRLFHTHKMPPWSGRFLRIGRVSDWIGVCGCQMQGYVTGSLHSTTLKLQQRLGGFYVLQARKQAVPLHPIMSKRRLLSDIPPNVITVPAARWQRTRKPIEANHSL